MTVDVLTKEDLAEFKAELMEEIKKIVGVRQDAPVYYKSREVKKILRCSDSTLQFYRDSGRVKAEKVGGTYYYPRTSVDNFLSGRC